MSADRCTPMRLGTSNHVPHMVLTSDPSPDTPLDNLKSEHKGRRTRWSNLSSGEIVITGTLPELRVGEFFAIPSFTLDKSARIKVELFDNLTTPVDLLQMGWHEAASMLPLGVFQMGIDEWGAIDSRTRPETLLIWFDRPIRYIRVRVTIEHAIIAGNVQVRMMMLGNKLQIERNFAYGSNISFLTKPELIYTASGSAMQVREQKKIRRLSLPLDQLSNNDRARLRMAETSLRAQPFIVSAHPGRNNWEYDDYNFLARWEDALTYSYFFEDIHEVRNFIMVEV